VILQGRIQDFKLGEAHLKKLCREEGGAKSFWVFRVKNHDFTPPPGSAPVLMVVYTVLIIHVTQYKRKVARNTKALRLIMRTTKNLTTNLVYIQTVSIYQYNLKQKVIIK
jgi:hypothetical protein